MKITETIKDKFRNIDGTWFSLKLVAVLLVLKFAFIPVHWIFKLSNKPYPSWLLPVAKVAIGNDSLDFYPEYLKMEDVSDRSTAFEYIGYSSVEYSVGVVFKSNPDRLYVYSPVDPDTYKEFKKADSLGSYYNEEIKGYYDCTRYDHYTVK